MAERLAASLLPAASAPSQSARRATVAAAASFPSPCSARAGLRLRSSRSGSARSAKAAGRGGGALRVVRCMAASDAVQLKSAREDIRDILKTTYCHPIMVTGSSAFHPLLPPCQQLFGLEPKLLFFAATLLQCQTQTHPAICFRILEAIGL